jgi:DNA gyrase subunit A
VVPSDEVLVFSSAGNIVRIAASEISEQGRDATGVRVARIGEGDTVVAVARVLEAAAENEVAGGVDDGNGVASAEATAATETTDTNESTGSTDGNEPGNGEEA